MTTTRIRGPVRHDSAACFADVLCETAADRPDDVAFQFLPDGEVEERALSWGALERRATSVAAAIVRMTSPSDRVLLLFAPGLEFIEAFLGCQCAGVIAVPAYPPRPERIWQGQRQVAAIASNCRPSLILTGGPYAGMVRQLLEHLPELAGVEWLNTDQVADSSAPFSLPRREKADVAMLQYTSGSTGDPKGVMVTHGNLLHNELTMQHAFGHMEETGHAAGVCWLPPYHDMGLMGHILHAAYIGFPCAIIPPAGILQRPVRWLRALSRYKADASGGPNFIYDICSRRITEQQRSGLDLSHWRIAGIGAEPVRAQTIDDFVAQYEPYGLRRDAIYPCYGLAEATLFVSGGAPHTEPQFKEVPRNLAVGERHDGSDSTGHEQQRLVSCGHAWTGTSIEIVDPDTRRACAGRVGEIWVAGDSVAAGYWERPDLTAETFGQVIAGDASGSFLRTGDLGFLDGEDLFIVGRLKDLVIIRGRNLHPQDIEEAVQSVHPAFRRDCGASFSVDVAGEERLVVMQEIDRQTRKINLQDLRRDILDAILQNFDLRPLDVVFLRNGTLPKTTSGKVRRGEARRRYLAGELTVWESQR